MTDYVDSIPNNTPVDQMKPSAPVKAQPQTASPSANSSQFQPWNRSDIIGPMATGGDARAQYAGQQTEVVGSGDLVAGDFEPGVGTRTPTINGLA
jgi:hypothetical protein